VRRLAPGILRGSDSLDSVEGTGVQLPSLETESCEGQVSGGETGSHFPSPHSTETSQVSSSW
jgi:hypothetical protein